MLIPGKGYLSLVSLRSLVCFINNKRNRKKTLERNRTRLSGYRVINGKWREEEEGDGKKEGGEGRIRLACGGNSKRRSPNAQQRSLAQHVNTNTTRKGHATYASRKHCNLPCNLSERSFNNKQRKQHANMQNTKAYKHLQHTQRGHKQRGNKKTRGMHFLSYELNTF